eukprot:TRINITY_DN2771_c0_g1_i1.p1 TRINITY_DN2771_c0_g1~~TRINITY_DN2771_c0_g1_i1.p1  ORF type:complete len:177 (-),score=19.68 TRINITY_DN2771_c0_g1_i1:228-758(-)
MWMINARLMVNSAGSKPQYTGIVHCVQSVYRSEGIGAFFAGLGGAAGTVVASAIQLSLYEQFKKLFPGLLQRAVGVFLLGALCKLTAIVITFPLTTVGSRMQNQRKNAETGSSEKVYTGTLDCMRSMVKAEGVGSLFAGLRPKMLQQFLQNGFRFLFYERIVTFLLRILLRKPVTI